jgi:hypothetical protein
MKPAHLVRGAFALLALSFLALFISRQVTQASPNGNLKVYLSLIRNSAAVTPTPTTPPTGATVTPTVSATAVTPTPSSTPTTVPGSESGALYITTAVETASGSAQVDATGGMHAAFIHYTSAPDPSPAVYATCTAPGTGCDNPANWTMVALGDNTREVQLQLNPQGKPRLLIVTDGTVYPSGKDYVYAECNTTCTSAAGWTLTRIASTDGTSIFDTTDDIAPQRSFALNPQGQPAFVYFDRNYFIEPDHIGVYYTFCASNCSNIANWQQTNIGKTFQFDYEVFEYTSLTFTNDGRPRLIASVYALNDDGSDAPDGIYYYECDSGCNVYENWGRTLLFYPGSGSYPLPAWDIEVGSNDAPHVAFFTGGGADSGIDYQLVYITCPTDCLADNSWSGTVLGLPLDDGQGPDIELTSNNQPRIAFMYDYDDLGYAWCDSNCAAADTSWQSMVVDTPDQQEADNSQALPPHCDQALWQGKTPTLALDADDNPHIAHDVTVDARCEYEDPENPGNPEIRFERVWNGVRWNFLPHP